MSVKISSLNTASTIDSGAAIHIAGNNPLTFSDWGGGWFMQDSTWVRSYNNKSLWMGAGYIGGDGCLTIGYGGTATSAGGAIIAGSVGIGTSTPQNKLHVIGNAWINRPSNKIDNNGSPTEFGSRVEFNNDFATSASGYMVFRYPTSNNFLIGGDYDGHIGGAIPNIQFGRSNGTVYLHIDASTSGNIGIGTTSPIFTLDVLGLSRTKRSGVNGAGLAGVIVLATDAKTIGDGQSLAFQGHNSSNADTTYGNIYTTIVSPTASAHSSSMTFKVYNSASGVDALTLANTGAATFASSVTTGGDIIVNNSSNPYSSTNRGAIFLNGVANSLYGFGVGGVAKGYLYHEGTNMYFENSVSGGFFNIVQVGAGYICFQTNGSEKMRLNSSGNLLIGTATDSGYKLYVNGTGLFNGVVNSYATMDNLARRFISPEGASYVTSTSSVTGAIKIKLPVARNNSSTMMMFRVKIYQYSTGNSFELQIGGYNYGLGNWYNVFATNLTDDGSNLSVRFGTDATSDCVWIGELGSTWSYPQVFVTDFQAGYSGQDIAWATGWGISFETAFDTVELSRLASQVITSRNIASQSVSYATTAGALTSMLISQFTNDSGYITSSALSAYLPLAGGNLTGLVQSTANIEATAFRTDGNFELTSANTGLKSNFYDTRFYASSTSYWNITTAAAATEGALLFRQGYGSTTKGYVYWDSAGFGLLNNTGGWAVRTNIGGSMGGTLYGAWSSSGSFTATALIKSGGTSSQFLKADGSIDTNAYITSAALSGYLPLTGGIISGALSVGGGLSTTLINLSDVTTLQHDAEVEAVGSLNNGNYGIVARTLYQQSSNVSVPYSFDEISNVIDPTYAVAPSPYDTYPVFAINSFKPGRAYRIKVQSSVSTTTPIYEPDPSLLDLNCKIYLIANDAVFPILTSNHHWDSSTLYKFPFQDDGRGYLSMEAMIHCVGVIEEEPPLVDVFSGQGQFSYSTSSTGNAYQSNRIVPMYVTTDANPYTGMVAYIPRNDTENYYFSVELSGSLLHFEIFSVTIEEL